MKSFEMRPKGFELQRRRGDEDEDNRFWDDVDRDEDELDDLDEPDEKEEREEDEDDYEEEEGDLDLGVDEDER